MYINTIIDEINLKNFPEIIIEYFRKNGEKRFNNLRSFYDILLKSINEDVRDSYLNRILKYLSSSTPILINIIEDFKIDIYNEELLKFSEFLTEEINRFEDYESLYETINRKINYIFYEKEDYLNIKEAHNKKDYVNFIFLVLKHTFNTYQTNTPGIVSTRMYEEAMTLVYDSETRKRMMKASADLGNLDASILHACHILKNNDPEGIDYLLNECFAYLNASPKGNLSALIGKLTAFQICLITNEYHGDFAPDASQSNDTKNDNTTQQ